GSRLHGAWRGPDPGTSARRVGTVPCSRRTGPQPIVPNFARRRGTRAERDVGFPRRGVSELGRGSTREADLRIAGRKTRDGAWGRGNGGAGTRVSCRSGSAN